jgi:NAD(P)H dehydrogenase (quinone)
MLVVTGSTGHVGRLVAEELAARGHDQRLLVRDPSRVPAIAGAEVVLADYGDPAALATALNEGDRVFMVSLHEGPERRVPLHRSFVSAAEAAGVAHVVYLSFVAAGPDAVFLHARSHGVTEELLAPSGMSFTSIRTCMYADDIPGWFDAEGIDRVPGGDGRMCFSYRPELARAIAVTLTEPGHESRVYDVVTPDAVSLAELAEVASEVTGDAYRYEPSDDAAWDARWRGSGKEEWAIEAGLSSYAALRQGEFDVRSDDYRTLTGEDPLTVAGVIGRLSDRMPLHRE